jgi:hypothetical protein
MFSSKKRQIAHEIRYCRGLFVLLVILLWRKFIYDKSASRMLINPGIVFTFTRQRWSIAFIFSSYLALPVWRSNIRNIPHLLTSYSSNFVCCSSRWGPTWRGRRESRGTQRPPPSSRPSMAGGPILLGNITKITYVSCQINSSLSGNKSRPLKKSRVYPVLILSPGFCWKAFCPADVKV